MWTIFFFKEYEIRLEINSSDVVAIVKWTEKSGAEKNFIDERFTRVLYMFCLKSWGKIEYVMAQKFRIKPMIWNELNM